MKRYLVVFVLLLSVIFTSCQITENIYLQEDGSGKISFDVDASGLMEIAGDKMMESGNGKDIDSTFTFKQIFAEKRQYRQIAIGRTTAASKMENMSVNMKMIGKTKEFKIAIFTDFKKANELQDMMQGLKSVKDLEKAPAGDAANPLNGMMNGANNTDLKYSYDGTTFKRSLKIIDPKVQEQMKDTTGMMNMMFASSQYTIKYHFPRKVKSVSNKNAMFSDDRKTVTIPYSLTEYLESPDKMSFEVVLDKK